MIVTVTLNPALDHFIFLESFERGVIQRFSQDVFAPGGKGVNVSLLLSSLGVENRPWAWPEALPDGSSAACWKRPAAKRISSSCPRGIPG